MKKKTKAEQKEFPKKTVEMNKNKKKTKNRVSTPVTVGDPSTEHGLVCGEFGKDKELWIQCHMCEEWAHAECTDGQSGSSGYICDECRFQNTH